MLHFNERGTEILSGAFIESISNFIHWQLNTNISLVDECKANLCTKEKLNILCKCKIDKIIAAHLSISSLKKVL